MSMTTSLLVGDCRDVLRSLPSESVHSCTVLDPFGGAGTTGLVADRHGRNAILIELNPDYAAMAERRINGDAPLFANVVRKQMTKVTAA